MQLVIAEKPNVAMSIAAVLGADKRQDGKRDHTQKHKDKQDRGGSNI